MNLKLPCFKLLSHGWGFYVVRNLWRDFISGLPLSLSISFEIELPPVSEPIKPKWELGLESESDSRLLNSKKHHLVEKRIPRYFYHCQFWNWPILSNTDVSHELIEHDEMKCISKHVEWGLKRLCDHELFSNVMNSCLVRLTDNQSDQNVKP